MPCDAQLRKRGLKRKTPRKGESWLAVPLPFYAAEQRSQIEIEPAACLSEASFRRRSICRVAQGTAKQPHGGIAFLLVTFLWRHKEKSLGPH
jgi:hypothetical protein